MSAMQTSSTTKQRSTRVCTFATTWHVIALFLLVLLPVFAQQNPPPSKQTEQVRRKIEGLASRAPISVVRIGAEEEFGTFLSHGSDSFTLYDVDLKRSVTLKYVEVRKVKSGYGGYHAVQKRHTDRTRALIVTLAVVGALTAVIVAAALAKS